jgi:hypothetical protein
MAEGSGGLSAFVSGGDNLQRQAAGLRRKLMRPAASNVEIKLSGIDAYDLVPPRLPDLYHGQPVRIYGRYRGAGTGKVAVAANVLGKPISQTVEFDFPKRDESAPEIERMWALKRVNTLLKQADDSGSRTEVIPEVIRLGEGYSIVTEYTSFLVLENDAEYARWKIQRRNALRVERDRAAMQRVDAELAKLRDQRAEQLGPAGVELVSTPTPGAVVPPASGGQQPNTSAQQPPAAGSPARSPRSRDLDGGGAIDPFMGMVLIGLGGVGCLTRRRVSRTA